PQPYPPSLHDALPILAHGSSGGVSNLIVAIVGGAVYRGAAIPELYGAYLFGEFYPNRPMRALYQCGSETSEVTLIQKRCDPNTRSEEHTSELQSRENL